jgi:hypothetical protein
VFDFYQRSPLASTRGTSGAASYARTIEMLDAATRMRWSNSMVCLLG